MGIGWNFYFSSLEGKPASIALNFDLFEISPDWARPHLLRVKLRMLEPRHDGLSSSKEAETLYAVEDALSPRLGQVCNARFVARITGNDHREWLFYGATHELAQEVVERVMSDYPAYSFSITHSPDPKWGVFLEQIYPREEEEQWVLNRRVLDLMQERGDKLDAPRDTKHFIYFGSFDERADFQKAAQSLGYAVEDDWLSENGRKFWICVSKRQDMNWGSLHDDFIDLFRATKASGGTYDGWECETVEGV